MVVLDTTEFVVRRLIVVDTVAVLVTTVRVFVIGG
jgi:hypothetical protein